MCEKKNQTVTGQHEEQKKWQWMSDVGYPCSHAHFNPRWSLLSPQYKPNIFSNIIVLWIMAVLAACLCSSTKVKACIKPLIGEPSQIQFISFSRKSSSAFPNNGKRIKVNICISIFRIKRYTGNSFYLKNDRFQLQRFLLQ